MRILIVGDAASVNVRRWCEGLADLGAEVHISSFEPGWRPDLPCHQLPLTRWGKARYYAVTPWLRAVAGRVNPDLVVGYYVAGYGTLARLLGRRPLVQVTAGADLLETAPGSILHRIVSRNLRSADLVIAWAQHMADAARDFGVEQDRILVQPRGIPLEGYARSAGTANQPAARVIVTRSLHRIYRHELLLEAMAKVGLPGLEMTVVGDGPEREALLRRRRELQLESCVHFVGRIANDRLPELLAEHDVYVSARPHDGVSASLLEAMAAGLVPVVIDHPANRDWIVDGATGLLVDRDPTAIAAGLRRAATDTKLRRRAAAENPRTVQERGDIRKNMPRFLTRLAELVDEHERIKAC